MHSCYEQSEGKPLRKAIVISSLICIFILFPSWLYISLKYENNLQSEFKRRTLDQLDAYANDLEKIMYKRFSLLEGLHAFTLANPENTQLDIKFLPFASALYTGVDGIRNFALAPAGVNRYVYPMQGNEEVIGHNLIDDPRPNVNTDIQRTLESSHIVLSGPYQLRQGGLGLVARKAVFLQNQFWGLATMVVDVPPLLVEAGINWPELQSPITLRKGNGNVFYGPKETIGT
jgi:sensor domain CHASE-containing protein